MNYSSYKFEFLVVFDVCNLSGTFRHHGKRGLGIVGKDPFVANGDVCIEEILQPHHVSSSDHIVRDVVPPGRYSVLDPLDGEFRRVEPEIQNGHFVSDGMGFIYDFDKGPGGQRRFNAEVFKSSKQVVDFHQHISAGSDGYCRWVERGQTLGEFIRIDEFPVSEKIRKQGV